VDTLDKKVTLHYQLEGAEHLPVLVLSNSLGTDLSMWDKQMEALTEHFRVLRYDSRGHGRSEVPDGPYSIDELGRDVVHLLDELGLNRVHFCGVSMGGMTGMWLSLNVPERLHKVALCNTAAYIGPREIWDKRIAAVGAGGMESILEGVIPRWFTQPFINEAPEEVEKIRNALIQTNPKGYMAACEAVRDTDFRNSVHQINVPTFVISGTEDLATPPSDGRYLSEQIPGSRYLELNAAHLSNIEASEEFTRELIDFIKDDSN
jgi:3-oxoadipate enol-lactonase